MSGHQSWQEIREGRVRQDSEPLRTLSELRRECGLNQQALADELGVSQASVSKIAHQDDPQVSTLMRYLGALGANLELRVVFPDRSAQLYFLDAAAEAVEKSVDSEADGHTEPAESVPSRLGVFTN